MTTHRQSALVAGSLFVVADVAGFLTFSPLATLNSPDYLATTTAHSTEVIIGVLLILTMELACAGIAVWLYPVLRRHHEAMALWAVVLRVIEAICGIVAALGLLALIPLSRAFVAAGAPEASYLQTLGDVIVTTREWTRDVVMLFAWGLGALLYNIIFYRARLLPRWLAGWGIVAIVLHLASCLLTLFEVVGPFSPLQIAMLAPSGLQELVLAIWLIVKGFDPAAAARLATREASPLEPRDLNPGPDTTHTGTPQPHAAL